MISESTLTNRPTDENAFHGIVKARKSTGHTK